MESMKRTTTCGALRASDAGKKVTINGWVHRKRDHGGVHFINLRDRYGITQVVIDENSAPELKDDLTAIKMEYCIAIEGTVNKRPDNMINKDMDTGEIELVAEKLKILSTCEVLPFMVDGDEEANESLRLKYRYLDLRREGMQKKMALRNAVTVAAREHLAAEGFFDIETPTLIKSTPEGARDFLVPSRIQPGKFFALPQSPQLYKQILMVSGFDKYYQIARCYRDEDLRGDRQFEFSQVDLEMSFVSADEIYSLLEDHMKYIFKKTKNIDLETPFIRLSYDDAMNKYGTDKPDLRFDMEFVDFAPLIELGDFGVFKSVVKDGGVVKAMVVPGVAADYSRKKITELEDEAKKYGAKGLAWMKVTENGLDGGISKFYADNEDKIKEELNANAGDLILFMGSDFKTAVTSLGAVRSKLGKDLNLYKSDEFKFAWVVDFPLFERNEDDNGWDPAHHMFSMPQDKYLDTMEENPGEVKGDLYDLILNGYELASGSIRIHDPEIQKRIFSIVGFPEAEAEEKFGFLLESFRYGPPPHGGLAYGLGRLVMILAEEESLKEVVAFPKNTSGISPLDNSPSNIDNDQLNDLSLKLNIKE